jgi:hypothetical protein
MFIIISHYVEIIRIPFYFAPEFLYDFQHVIIT